MNPVPEADVTAEQLAALRQLSTATVTMQLLKRGLRSCYMTGVRPLDPGNCRFAAEVYTLRFVPMREDLSRPEVLADPEYAPRKAIEEVPPGQVLVIDCRGEQGAGSIGDILALRLHRRGVAAAVADGPVRDAAAVRETGLAVFCSGAAAPASLNVHFGADLQHPVACGGVTVFPGDVLVGDGDGVVVIPRSMAAEIAADGAEQERLETFLKQRIDEGHPTIGTYPPNAETLAAYEAWYRDKSNS